MAAFHCQQGAEKRLKAFLVHRRRPFEKIHDLGRILDLCAAIDDEFEDIRDLVEPLTIYAVAYRYPGPADPSLTEVQRAAKSVEQVWTFVTARLASRDVE